MGEAAETVKKEQAMGVFDFVKNGVREMMVARPDNLKQLIVYKHPDQNIPMYSQLTVDSDECAVFFKDGRVVGVLPPGRVTLQTQNIPFLNQLVTNFTGGQVFISGDLLREDDARAQRALRRPDRRRCSTR